MIYTYYCEKCKRTFDVRHSIDFIPIIHSDITEGHENLSDICDGKIKKVIQPVNFILKGTKTSKFFGGKK